MKSGGEFLLGAPGHHLPPGMVGLVDLFEVVPVRPNSHAEPVEA